MSQQQCAAYLRERGAAPQSKQYCIEDVKVDNLTTMQLARLRKELRKEDSKILVKSSEDLPMQFLDREGNPVVHSLLVKDNAVPQRIKTPRFPQGSPKTQCLSEISENNVASGLWKIAKTTEWSSRALLVAKYDLNASRMGAPSSLRFVGDYV